MITMILLTIEKSIQNMKEILLMTQLNQDIWQAKCYTNEFKETVKHNEIHLVSIITLSNILKHNIILKKEHCSIKLTLSADLSCNTKGQQMCVHFNLSNILVMFDSIKILHTACPHNSSVHICGSN